jgi:hypothetical protein
LARGPSHEEVDLGLLRRRPIVGSCRPRFRRSDHGGERPGVGASLQEGDGVRKDFLPAEVLDPKKFRRNGTQSQALIDTILQCPPASVINRKKCSALLRLERHLHNGAVFENGRRGRYNVPLFLISVGFHQSTLPTLSEKPPSDYKSSIPGAMSHHQPGTRPPRGPEWLIEIKHDGFRVIARKEGKRVRLYSRPGNDLTYRFPLIVEALSNLRLRSCIMDGEAVSCGPDGIASFDRIRYRRHDADVFMWRSI